MKIFRWLSDNILFIFTLFLLVFIPLYPKLPVVNINHTWVYIRAEDFIVAFVFLIFIALMLAKKVTLKTPLTIPILLFWIIGGIATLHGILLIFPTLGNVFPNVAFLNYIRRIEYISLFFIAFWAIKDKKLVPYVVATLAITLFLVAAYGIGQKYLGFPAFLTMNEEFAKGIPLRLSALSRVSSTFGGHYDLAAYLVLIIPILTSMVFGVRHILAKFFLLASVASGFIVLFMTVSRVSFFVLLISLVLVLLLHKKRLAILAMISLFVTVLIFLSFSTSLLQRFVNTVKEVDVLVIAATGEALGEVKEIPSEKFKNTTIKLKFVQNKRDIDAVLGDKRSFSAVASDAAVFVPFAQLPPSVPVFNEANRPTGESLPQGTGYVNLTLAPILKKVDQFYYQKLNDQGNVNPDEAVAMRGDFLIKRVVAYDLSFTTRFQGEWPHALAVFKKDILLGGGYSAVGLAMDNDYIRMLGEVGLLGLFSYSAIFLVGGIYIKKILPEVESPVVKSFILGFIAGTVGLIFNAVLIDVFEASKVAFVFWLLVGVSIGTLHLYQKKELDLFKEFKNAITSTYAVIIYIFFIIFAAFASLPNYYFVGDDFTWFRWVADCPSQANVINQCQSIFTTIFNYFTQANGFFYRPGTKTYFLLMYSGFWLNQSVYHMVSILLHFLVVVLVFLISKKILKDFFLSVSAAFLFIILSGYSEVVFWISSTGFLFNALFALLSLLLFIHWNENKKRIYFIFSVISLVLSLFFHELGIVTPLFLLLYAFIYNERFNYKELFKNKYYLTILSPVLPYLGLRYLAQSHWLNGDYSYNLIKLPFNFVGNTLGYLMLSVLGPQSLSLYELLRGFSRANIILASLVCAVIVFFIILVYKKVVSRLGKEDQKIIAFGSLFFIIALLPFLGLGNVTSRYSYLASAGFVILFVFILKKIYSYIFHVNGKNISVAISVILISIFSLIHIIQLQQAHTDWFEAGEKSKRFITSLDQAYANYWTKEQMNLYFVNVPIRKGDAWIFPVGLSDAVWFVFRNKDARVYQSSSLNEAFSQVKNVRTDRVFEFNNNGSIIERDLPGKTAPLPVSK